MKKVILVEDEKVIRKGLRKLIEDVIGGCKVIGEAENGKKALELMKVMTPDLVITDIRMDEMNGIDMIKRIRSHNKDLKILIVTGHADFVYAQQAIKFGVSDYLLKPVDRVELTLFLEQFERRGQGDLTKQYSDKEDENNQGRQIIRQVKELVMKRLDQDISLQYVAEQVHLNHQYLSTLFKAETGQNFSEFVTLCRMNRAKELLKNTNLKVYEIASLSGYVSSKHFMAVFKQMIGLTPTEYRERPDE